MTTATQSNPVDTKATIVCSTLDREKWLQERRNGIGSSDAPAILGIPSWTYSDPLSVYTSKLGLDEESDAEILRWGHLLEPIIGKQACIENDGEYIQWPVMLAHPEHNWMRATVDNWVKLNGATYPMEVKNVGFKAGDWLHGIPDYVTIQHQHQLAVTGAPFGFVAALFQGNTLGWEKVERNDDLIENVMIPSERTFWENFKAGNQPDPSALAASTEALKKLYPHETGEVIPLAPEFMEEADALADLKQRSKDVKDSIREIENRIKAAIGDAVAGDMSDGSSFTFKTTNRKGYEVNPTSYRTLRFKKAK